MLKRTMDTGGAVATEMSELLGKEGRRGTAAEETMSTAFQPVR